MIDALLRDGTALKAAETHVDGREEREHDREERDDVAPPQVAAASAARRGAASATRVPAEGLRRARTCVIAGSSSAFVRQKRNGRDGRDDEEDDDRDRGREAVVRALARRKASLYV